MEQIFRFKVVGNPPGLMQHSPHWLMRKATAGPVGKNIPSPEVEARMGLYIMDEAGAIVHPSLATEACFLVHPVDGFVEAIFAACVGKKIGKIAAARILRAAIRPPEAESWAILRDPDTWEPKRLTIVRDSKGDVVLDNPQDAYAVDVRRVVVQGNGILRGRPSFKTWGAEVPIVVATDTVSEAVVRDVLATAGKIIGVGEYNPRYGRFDFLPDKETQ
jgi:hypothetical protein